MAIGDIFRDVYSEYIYTGEIKLGYRIMETELRFLRSVNSSNVSNFVTFTAPNGQKLHSVEEIKTYLFSNGFLKIKFSRARKFLR